VSGSREVAAGGALSGVISEEQKMARNGQIMRSVWRLLQYYDFNEIQSIKCRSLKV
jgi:hypothetical protein